jgi:membrane protein DedA with SNARE-associated domain
MQEAQGFAGFLTNFISHYGYLAVFIFMAAESCLIPIPSEVTMTFAGFLSGVGILNIWVAIALGAVGNLVGSLIAFCLGRKMGEEWIRVAIRKWGKYLFIHEKDFDKAADWFDKYGQGITFGSRLLPIVRTFISLPAGIAEMDVKLFGLLTFVGSLIWSGVLAFLGLKLGQNWQAVEPYFRQFQYVIVAAFALFVAVYIWRHARKNKKH